MSKRVARAIAGMADLLTLPLNSNRRMETRAQAAEYLAAVIPVETRHGQIKFFTNTQRGSHYPWFFHTDEPETLAWIDGFEPGACLWDIGANIGTFSLYAALKKDTRILGFEPSASSYAVFTKNIEINAMDDRIRAYCIAFSQKTGLDLLNMASTEAGHSMHGFGTDLNAFEEIIETKFRQAVPGYSMDDFLATFNPEPPTHIKLDVDGIEADILRGAGKVLGMPQLKSVLIEVMDDVTSPRNAEIIEVMRGNGFVGREKASVDVRNMVFERET